MNTLHWIDYAVIGAYFLAMIAIGVWSVKMAKNRDDYLVARRRLNFPMFFACMAALAVGGAVTVGGSGKGYETGVAGVWVGGSLGMGLIALGILVSSKVNRMRALSVNEVIERNYGTTARVFGAVLTIIYTISLTVVQVVSMGAILVGILDIDVTTAMLSSGLVVVFYTFLGGMWSVTLTDIVQFVVKTLGIMVLVPIFVLTDPQIGGWSGLVAKVPESHWDIGAFGFSGTLYWVLLYVPGLVIGQDIWQRVFTARNDRIARTGTISAGVYSIVYAFAGVMLGLAVYAVGIQLDDPSLAFEAGVERFLPVGAAGLLLAAAMAASMSVASGTILACSTIVYNDLYLRFIRKESAAGVEEIDIAGGPGSATRDVWINRCIALAIGLLTVLLAVVISDIFTALDLAYAFLSGCVFIPVFASFVVKKVSQRAGLVTLAVSFVVVAGTMVYGSTTGQPDFAVGGNWPITFGIISGLITYVTIHVTDRNKRAVDIEIDPAHETISA